jgi:hypothetical protein
VPRSTALIQAEITALEAAIIAILGGQQSYTANGITVTKANLAQQQTRLDALYAQLDRATGASPMIVRGRVTGLPGGPVAGE